MLRAFTSFPSTTRPTKWLGFRRSGACRRLPQRPTVAPPAGQPQPGAGPGARTAERREPRGPCPAGPETQAVAPTLCPVPLREHSAPQGVLGLQIFTASVSSKIIPFKTITVM